MDPAGYFQKSNSIGYLKCTFKFDPEAAVSVVEEAVENILLYKHPIEKPVPFFRKVLKNCAIRMAKARTKHAALRLEGLDPMAPVVSESIDTWPDRVFSTIALRPKEKDCELLKKHFVEGKTWEEVAQELGETAVAVRSRFSEIKRRAIEQRAQVA